jgi:phage anti-repressor protein
MKREDLKVFESGEFGKVRVIMNNGIPMFSAIDVAKSLGYSDSDQAIRIHCKKSDSIFVLHGNGKPGGTSMKFIPESDIFRLVMSSKLPEAEKFQDWVFEEVLPSIRKTGGYIETNDSDSDEDILARAILIAQKTIESKNLRIKELETKVSEDAPVVKYTKEFLRIEDSDKTTTQVAKEYGLSAYRLNRVLESLGVQYPQSGQWFLKQEYSGKGYANMRKRSVWMDRLGRNEIVQSLVWTEKGRKFIYDLAVEGKFWNLLNKKETESVKTSLESLKNSALYNGESIGQ